MSWVCPFTATTVGLLFLLPLLLLLLLPLLGLLHEIRDCNLNLFELFKGGGRAKLAAVTNAELAHQVVEITDRPITRTTSTSL